jgi:hypothetical protein
MLHRKLPVAWLAGFDQASANEHVVVSFLLCAQCPLAVKM